jgi:predicted nuclease of predicted toxin-antitoxin system
VNLLLDEQLDSPDMRVAQALSILGSAYECAFRSLRVEAPGMKDPDIPAYCQREGIDALVSANIRDFGARQALYEALVTAGVSVVVIRPQRKQSLSVEQQASLLTTNLRYIAEHLTGASEPILIRANESGAAERTLDDLRHEILGEGRLP